MTDQYRNVILFFEENADTKQIANRMVLLYMNRFTIDEDQRFEIIGVFTLSKVPEIHRDSLESLNDATMKNLRIDEQIVFNGFKNSVNSYQFDTKMKIHIHFIIGTSIYGKFLYTNTKINKFSSIHKRIMTWSQKHFPSIWISLTILDGKRHRLFNKIDVQKSYRTQRVDRPFDATKQELFNAVIVKKASRPNMYATFGFVQGPLPTGEFIMSHGALNDDLENFYERNCGFELPGIEKSRKQKSGPRTKPKRNRTENRKKSVLCPNGRVLFLYEYLEDSEKEKYTDKRTLNDDEYLLSICTRLTVTSKSSKKFSCIK